MNVDTMRRIDRWAGVPACFALTLVDRLRRAVAPRRASGPVRQVLIVQLSEMGSLALASPAVGLLRRQWPDARVRFLVFRRNRAFLQVLGLVDERDIWTIDDTSLLGFVRSTLAFVRRARREGIDTVLDYEIFSRASAILSVLSGARRRAGFCAYEAEGLYRGDLLTHPVFYNVYKHIGVNFAAMVRAVAGDAAEQPAVKENVVVDLEAPRYEPSPERREAMRERIQGALPSWGPGKRLIVLSPFSGNLLPIRAWPARHYAELLRILFDRTDDTVALVMGLPETRAYCRPIFEAVRSPRLGDFIGRTGDIAEVLDLLSLADAFVASDSGPPHFAAMVGTPTLAMFGPESPALYGPMGDRVRTVYLGLHCSPCVTAFNHRKTPCTHNLCMENIAPARMLEALLEMLNEGKRDD